MQVLAEIVLSGNLGYVIMITTSMYTASVKNGNCRSVFGHVYVRTDVARSTIV